MRRRLLLRSLGSVAAAGAFAGCLSSRSPGGEAATTVTDGGRTTRFAGDPCPSFAPSADRTVCYHAADADADVLLSPSTELFEPADGAASTVTFELSNRSDRPVGLNPYAWRIERRTDDGWRHVAPGLHPEPWTQVGPGQSYRWEWSATQHPAPSEDGTMQVVQSLDAGVYAFGVDGTLKAAEGDASRVEWVALFEVA